MPLPQTKPHTIELFTQLKLFSSNKFRTWPNLSFPFLPSPQDSDNILHIGYDAPKESQKKRHY